MHSLHAGTAIEKEAILFTGGISNKGDGRPKGPSPFGCSFPYFCQHRNRVCGASGSSNNGTITTSATYTGMNMSVQYTYDSNDYLTQVKTPTTTYNFEHGVFGLRTSVKIGSRTLASYRYTDDRNFYLEGLDYSNGDSVDYTYDDKGRILSATYEDGDTVAYAYSTGNGSLC